jgi:Glyoxalase/Bleomycin resistance protein/Dioxygenase superfamily
MHPKTDGILESSLYVNDVPRSIRFYQEIFGFSVISEFGERGCAMHAGARQVHARCCCCSKRELRAQSLRLTMGTVSYTSRSQFQSTNCPTGSHGSNSAGSTWKRSANGKRAAGAFTFETRIAT